MTAHRKWRPVLITALAVITALPLAGIEASADTTGCRTHQVVCVDDGVPGPAGSVTLG